MLLTTLSERDKESRRRSETFIHVGRIKRVDQETTIPEADLGGHCGYNATSLLFLEYKA